MGHQNHRSYKTAHPEKLAWTLQPLSRLFIDKIERAFPGTADQPLVGHFFQELQGKVVGLEYRKISRELRPVLI